MRKIIILSACLSISFSFVFSQTNIFPTSGSVGIGTTTPNANAQLEVNDGNYGKIKVGWGTYVGSTWQGYSGNAVFGRNVYTGDYDNVRALSTNGVGSQYILMANHAIAFHVIDGTATSGNIVNNQVAAINTTGLSIGAITPRYKLDVIGEARIGDGNMILNSSGGLGIRLGLIGSSFTNLNSTDAFIGALTTGGPAGLSGDLLLVPRSSTGVNSAIRFYTGPTTPLERFTITYNGNIGIGTSTPGAMLDINGTTYSRELYVGTPDANTITYMGSNNLLAVNGTAVFVKAKVAVYGSTWPDYVFSQNYKLTSLDSLEQFIQLNKHLPGVPTADDVQKNGIDLGDNQVLLLKKIEELTLMMIEQNKKQIDLENLIVEQNERIKKLESIQEKNKE